MHFLASKFTIFLYIWYSIMVQKKHVNIEIDKLTNSIENVITGGSISD